MKKNILTSALALTLILNPVSAFADGDEDNNEDITIETHTMTFLDFDGEIMQKIEVTPEEQIDYSQVDTSALHSFIDIYTEQAFSSWSSQPEYISEDTTVQALWKKGYISTKGTPLKTEYYSRGADIDFAGLSVLITFETQTADTDEDGNFIVEKEENDITSSCHAEKSLEETLSGGKKGTVNVIPAGEDKPIFSYEVTLFDSLGDTNGDGMVDAVDSSFILETYADFSTGAEVSLDKSQQKICDINQDGEINAIDATYVLMFYAEASTSGNAVWENIIENNT